MVAATRSAPPAANEPTTMTIRRVAPATPWTGVLGRAVLTIRLSSTSDVPVASRRNCSGGGRKTLSEPVMVAAVSRPSPLLLVPGLEHDHVPQPVCPVAATAYMFQPLLADWTGVQKALAPQTRFIQQRLGPVTQRSAQPAVDRNAEPHLRTISQGPRNVVTQKFLQQPFSCPGPDTQSWWQRPREFDHAVIQHRDPRLERYCHGGAI